MITALWTHEWLSEAPNCISPSLLTGGTSYNGLGKNLFEGGEYILSFIKYPVAALEQGTEDPAAPLEVLSGRRVHHYSKVRSVQNVTLLSGNKDRNLNHQKTFPLLEHINQVVENEFDQPCSA